MIVVIILGLITLTNINSATAGSDIPYPYPVADNVWRLPVYMYDLDSSGQNAYLPLVFCDTCPPPPTPTNTPKPPTPIPPTPTPTPTPIDGEGGYTWLFAGRAGPDGEDTVVFGIVPGVCYYAKIDHYELDGKMVILRSQKYKLDTWPCVQENFNPDMQWPPPEYDVPPEVPPPFGWGDTFKQYIPGNYKYVCGYCDSCGYGTLNCIEVDK